VSYMHGMCVKYNSLLGQPGQLCSFVDYTLLPRYGSFDLVYRKVYVGIFDVDLCESFFTHLFLFIELFLYLFIELF
jgi:hypothetical protein